MTLPQSTGTFDGEGVGDGGSIGGGDSGSGSAVSIFIDRAGDGVGDRSSATELVPAQPAISVIDVRTGRQPGNHRILTSPVQFGRSLATGWPDRYRCQPALDHMPHPRAMLTNMIVVFE